MSNLEYETTWRHRNLCRFSIGSTSCTLTLWLSCGYRCSLSHVHYLCISVYYVQMVIAICNSSQTLSGIHVVWYLIHLLSLVGAHSFVSSRKFSIPQSQRKLSTPKCHSSKKEYSKGINKHTYLSSCIHIRTHSMFRLLAVNTGSVYS